MRLADPPMQLGPGSQAVFGVKAFGREDDASHPFSVDVRNEWIFTSTCQIYLYLHSLDKEDFSFVTSRVARCVSLREREREPEQRRGKCLDVRKV